MSWQISEEQDKLTFSRLMPGSNYFIKIELDHGPGSDNLFFGEIYRTDRSLFLAATSGTSLLSVMDRLLNMVYEADPSQNKVD